MSVELRELRCLVAIVDRGTFTDAALELRMSQAAVSRNLASLEHKLGIRLLGRTTRRLELTAAGERALRQARRVLGGVDELEREARGENERVRIGYAWSALGRHTVPFQRRWAAAHPGIELELVRSNTATAGLDDGTAHLAILRRPPPTDDYDLVLIGLEKRVCAMAADDGWAKRRSVTLAEVAERRVAIDAATGTTSLGLWPASTPPRGVVNTHDVEDWLTVISSGRAVGVSAESTADQYRRPGIVFRPVRDGPPIPVYIAWSRGDVPRDRDAVVELLVDLYR
ncbi:LysR family transcriptional regulator [Conyzicola nivalis]|uniref:LysR family transcriptional regulator n=1 Tax=Conyzicola nivalis TaxID=1477021 RepID=A0A916SGB9_9MICO|nr:LysR family transcriptional regulator [Conyzicola nivalis]GGA99121.1 LysR family transcriptional regulator [Conyzicola nivalis]